MKKNIKKIITSVLMLTLLICNAANADAAFSSGGNSFTISGGTCGISSHVDGPRGYYAYRYVGEASINTKKNIAVETMGMYYNQNGIASKLQWTEKTYGKILYCSRYTPDGTVGICDSGHKAFASCALGKTWQGMVYYPN